MAESSARDAPTPEELRWWRQARRPQAVPAVLRDYVATVYPPVVDPAGRAASDSLLRYFLLAEGLVEGLWPIVVRFVELLGPGQTVWGIKRLPGGRCGVELYVYDPHRDASFAPKGRDNPRSVTRLVAGLAGVVAVDSRLDDDRASYHMASLELDATVAATGRSDGFRIYPTGDRRRHGYDGVSYHVAGDRLVRENHYRFFSAADELDEVRAALAASIRRGPDPDRLLDPVLCRCHTICFSSKAHGDALYFSRLDTAQVLAVLPRLWPGAVERALRHHADDFAHLRWDLGIDFRVPATDLSAVTIDKVGLYGFI
ncbi:MAG: hypothetical protein D6798_12745 [Deltaproteobacteria bacterium]|nr:MAG: hypothetical protein D6798_12745 [Deltaproteobacteria bacterium]